MARQPAPLPYNATPEQRLQYVQEWNQYQSDLAAEDQAAIEAKRASVERLAQQSFEYQGTQDARDYETKKRGLDLKYKELIDVGIPTAKADRWYKEQQAQIAREQLIENRRQFDASTGLDVLKTGAMLSGPENTFEAADYARGIRERGDLPYFLQQLKTTGAVTPAGGNYSAVPTPLSLGSIAARMGAPGAMGSGTGQGASGQPDEYERALAAVTQVGRAPGKIAPNTLENDLLPSERKAFMSGIGKSGFNKEDWLNQYRFGTQLGFGNWT